MANKKMTKRDYFNILRSSYPIDANNYNDVIAFIDHELELLDRKNSSEKKPTATQTANAATAEAIYNTMEDNHLYTIAEMIKNFPCCADMSTSKVSAILRPLYNAEPPRINRIVDKKKTFFQRVVE